MQQWIAKEGDTITLPTADQVSKENQILVGWKVNDSTYDPGAIIEVPADMTIQAVWDVKEDVATDTPTTGPSTTDESPAAEESLTPNPA